MHGIIHFLRENLFVRRRLGKAFLSMTTTHHLAGSLSVFGYPSTRAHLEAIRRSTGWRGFRATLFLAVGVALTPVVALVPPHAPWAVAALGTAGFLAFRKWRERFTLLSLEGACPRCHHSLMVRKRTPLGKGLTLSCPSCNHDVHLNPEIPPRDAGRGDET